MVRDDLELLMAVVDDCDRAIAQMADHAECVIGVRMVRDRVISALALRGITNEYPEGEDFDPHRHEAIGTTDDGADGVVAQVTSRGWFQGEVMMRPAKVIVARGDAGHQAARRLREVDIERRRRRSDA